MTAAGEGTVRIWAADPSESVKTLLWEGRTESLDASTTDPRQMVQIPKSMMRLPQDHRIFIEMKGDSATTVDNTGKIRVPVRIKTLATGVIRDADLVWADFGVSTTDITVATTYTRLGTQYTVNAGEVVSFGKTNYDNSQLLLEMAYT